MLRTSRAESAATGSESTRLFQWLSAGKTVQRGAPLGAWPLANAPAHRKATAAMDRRRMRIA